MLAVDARLLLLRYSYFPGGGENDTDWLAWTEQEENLASAVALVPPGIGSTPRDGIVPHLAHRRRCTSSPRRSTRRRPAPICSKIDVFVFDLTDSQTVRALDATDQDTVLTRRPRFTVRVWGESDPAADPRPSGTRSAPRT